MKEKHRDTALTIASMMGSMNTDNFADSIVKTAEVFKDLTGEDLGIKSLKETRNRVNKVKKPWYKIWK